MGTGDFTSGMREREIRRSVVVEFLTVVTYLALLAGPFGFDRIGLSNPLIIPERLFAAIILLAFVALLVLVNPTRNLSPIKTHFVAAMIPLLYLVLSAGWAPAQAELASQIVDLACMVLFSCSFVLLVKWDRAAVVNSLMWCLAVGGVVFSFAGLASSSVNTRVAAFGGGPNVYSRITVLGIIGLVWLVTNKKLGIWFLAVVPVMLVATIVSGSRGGMLAGIVGCWILLPVVFRLGKGKLLAATGVASIAGFIVYRAFGDVVVVSIQGRIIQLTLVQGYDSGRGDLLNAAITMFRDNLIFGAGLRSFSTEFGQGFDYPHNLFAQIAAESGIVGLFLILILLSKSVYVAFTHRSSVTVRCFTAAGSVILTSAMFSGGYYDARFLWIFILAVFVSADRSDNVDSPMIRRDSRAVVGRKNFEVDRGFGPRD
jgi:O-antigen ligase